MVGLKKNRSRRVRTCRWCGRRMGVDRLWLCKDCQALGRGAQMPSVMVEPREVLAVAKSLEAQGIYPLEGFKMEDVACLARCYKPPYESYGKLKGYVEGTGRLPPEMFERVDEG